MNAPLAISNHKPIDDYRSNQQSLGLYLDLSIKTKHINLNFITANNLPLYFVIKAMCTANNIWLLELTLI